MREVRFDLGKPDLAKDPTLYGTDTLFLNRMYKNLDSLAYALILDTGFFEIQHHADCRYNHNSSSQISTRRAISVMNYLILKGVDSGRLTAMGYADYYPRMIVEGEAKTMLTCKYINAFKESDLAKFESLHQLNRRIVVKRIL